MSLSPNFKILIPARLNSSRLAEKILLTIAGKPMLQHVYERATASQAKEVIIATDDDKIARVAASFGAKTVITAKTHLSGTSRIAEALTKLQFDEEEIIVNVQGDEPLISPLAINETAYALATHPKADMATLCQPIMHLADLENPNVVKVIRNEYQFALYFSRALIPWAKEPLHFDSSKNIYWQHIGLYAYSVKFIKQYVSWKPCVLEQLESLEQLRALWYGAKILVRDAPQNSLSIGVDTEADLIKVRAFLDQKTYSL